MVDGECAAVVAAPDDEGPSCAVPESTEEHGGDEDEDGAGAGAAAAAEWDVEVVAKEAGEGDVPAAPEFDDGGGLVGGVEVDGEFEVEHECESAGHV